MFVQSEYESHYQRFAHDMGFIDLVFEEFYFNDYQLLQNELVEERTLWRDKYTTVLHQVSLWKI